MNRIKLKTALFFLLILSLSTLNAQINDTTRLKLDRLETAFNIVENSYPKYRYYDAGISFVLGGSVAYRGITVLNDNQSTGSEKNTAYAILGFGSIRVIDGLYGFFFSTPVEKNLKKFQKLKDNQQKIDFGEMKLKEAANREKLMRYFRSFLIGGSGAALTSLAVIDYDKHKIQGYAGILMIGASIYRLLSKSPAEKAWNLYKKSARKEEIGGINFYISPYPQGFVTGVYLRF